MPFNQGVQYSPQLDAVSRIRTLGSHPTKHVPTDPSSSLALSDDFSHPGTPPPVPSPSQQTTHPLPLQFSFSSPDGPLKGFSFQFDASKFHRLPHLPVSSLPSPAPVPEGLPPNGAPAAFASAVGMGPAPAALPAEAAPSVPTPAAGLPVYATAALVSPLNAVSRPRIKLSLPPAMVAALSLESREGRDGPLVVPPLPVPVKTRSVSLAETPTAVSSSVAPVVGLC